MKNIYRLIKNNNIYSKISNTIYGLTLVLFCVNSGNSFSQVTYSFTTAGATSSVGPTQAQINAAYAATNLNGSVVCPSGIQSFTFLNGGPYQITAAGAGGGGANSFGGRGIIAQGNYTFAAGDVIRVVVGQKGMLGLPPSGSSGGGGGSYVILYNGNVNTPIIIGGGGAGFLGPVASALPSTDANILQSGFASYDALGAGGTSGNGGYGSSQWGGGGGGYLTDGTAASACIGSGGQAFVNGSLGAATCYTSPGGFGGGGGTHGNTGGGGGGGGYSGGGGSGQSFGNPNGGGGGGSYFSAALSNTLNGGLNINNGYVTITQLCNAAIAPVDTTAIPNKTVCPGGTTTLAASGTGTITWYATNVSTLVLGTGSTFVTAPGTYTYFAAASNTCSQGPRTAISVSVVPPPALTITGQAAICNGYTINLGASGANSYSWSTGAVTPTVNVIANSQYTLSGFSAATGCSNTVVSNLTLMPAPSVAVTGPTAVCAGSAASLTASGADMYFWNTGATTSTIVPTITNNVTYTIIGTYTLNGCTTKVTKPIISNALPSLSVSGTSTMCPGNSVTITASGAPGLFWSTGASTASVVLSPGGSTNYSVVGVSSAGCTNTLVVPVNVVVCDVGIKSQTRQSERISVYPNPTNGEFMIDLNDSPAKTYEIADLTGRIILKGNFEKDKTPVNLNAYTGGVYFIKIKGSTTVDVIKIIKQ